MLRRAAGSVVSMLKSRVAGVGSVFPAASLARTRNVCAPPASGAVVCGDVQLANGPLSTAHSKVAPGTDEWKANVGVWSVVAPCGPESMIVSGSVVLTVKETCATAPVRPEASVALTENLCAPSRIELHVKPDEQAKKLPPSFWHRSVGASRSSSVPNRNCCEPSLTSDGGNSVKTVVGARVSTK